jgi:hypothetical protein
VEQFAVNRHALIVEHESSASAGGCQALSRQNFVTAVTGFRAGPSAPPQRASAARLERIVSGARWDYYGSQKLDDQDRKRAELPISNQLAPGASNPTLIRLMMEEKP